MTAEDSDGVSSSLQTHAEKRAVNKNQPVLDEHGPVTLFEAVEKLAGDKDVEENVESLRKDKSYQENSGRTSPIQTDFEDSMTRLFNLQDIISEIIASSSPTKYTLALAQTRKDRMTSTVRAEGPYQQFAGGSFHSVAKCRGVKHREAKPQSKVTGQSTTKPRRTAAEWKRRNRSGELFQGRINMAS